MRVSRSRIMGSSRRWRQRAGLALWVGTVLTAMLTVEVVVYWPDYWAGAWMGPAMTWLAQTSGVRNPYNYIILTPLAVLFAVIAAYCLYVGSGSSGGGSSGRTGRLSTMVRGLSLALWAFLWVVCVDQIMRVLAWADEYACTRGWIPYPTGDVAMVERMNVHEPIAISLSALITAAVLWFVFGTRRMALAGVTAAIVVATLFGVLFAVYGVSWLDWMGRIWWHLITATWFAIVVGAMLKWAGERLETEAARSGNKRCGACGYDLQGNTSGVCPECGEVIGNADGGVPAVQASGRS